MLGLLLKPTSLLMIAMAALGIYTGFLKLRIAQKDVALTRAQVEVGTLRNNIKIVQKGADLLKVANQELETVLVESETSRSRAECILQEIENAPDDSNGDVSDVLRHTIERLR